MPLLQNILSVAQVLALGLAVHSVNGAQASEPKEASLLRLNYHSAPEWAGAVMRDQHRFSIPSALVFDDGRPVQTADDWILGRRPELVNHWTRILGKISPSKADQQWFGDIRDVEIHATEAREGYTRIHLSLPIEKDFLQPQLLLLPSGQGEGPFPAVIAWTSTSPDYQKPEEWWGAWLARRGYVVLTGWSFIRHYRQGKNYRDEVNEMVYERFGRWLPMSKMVHDVTRETEYLLSRPEVDPDRLGFIGFSLSAKTALYVAAFAPQIKATVAVDPHVALCGDTNYQDPWYLDWYRPFDDIETSAYPQPALRGTVWSLLDADPSRPGFERNHHELMALCAPRALLLIGCSMDKMRSAHSDNLQSWGYFNRAKEVYEHLGIPERLQFEANTEGHQAVSDQTDPVWQRFFRRWLKETPIE